LSIEDQESGRVRGGFDQFVFDGQVAAEVEELTSAAETLRAKFEEEAVTALGPDYAARMPGGFDDLRVNAGLAQGMRADQPGDSGADD
jgi:hypothetical protein